MPKFSCFPVVSGIAVVLLGGGTSLAWPSSADGAAVGASRSVAATFTGVPAAPVATTATEADGIGWD
jgi:hypothetical protein